MQRLVGDLLDLSKLEAGQSVLKAEKIDLVPILQQCLEIFALAAESHGIELNVRLPAILPAIGDADRLEQVFSNLIDNAIKNTQDGGWVRVEGRAEEDGGVTIGVSDNGLGIENSELPHIFDRFFGSGRTGLNVSTGLGLAIAKEIVTAHGGEIKVESVRGSGSRFTIHLSVPTF